MSVAEKARRKVLAVEIPRDELACRIAEKCIGMRRPNGASGTEALEQLMGEYPGMVAAWKAAADAAVMFFHECVNAGKQPS